jgi:hypothetical protein
MQPFVKRLDQNHKCNLLGKGWTKTTTATFWEKVGPKPQMQPWKLSFYINLKCGFCATFVKSAVLRYFF